MTDKLRDAYGREWVAGCHPRVSTFGDGTFRVFDPDDLPPRANSLSHSLSQLVDLVPLVWHVINQGNQGSCCGCMGVGLMMLIRELFGLDRVVLSQASLYGQGNGGRDQGMAIDTCLRLLTDVGACPVDVIDQYDWQGFHRGSWPGEWKTIAPQYRALEVLECRDLDAVHRGNEKGFPVGVGAKGHAFIRLAPGLDLNSWGAVWGNNGIGQYASDRELRAAIPTYGAFLIYSPRDPAGDGDLPQPTLPRRMT